MKLETTTQGEIRSANRALPSPKEACSCIYFASLDFQALAFKRRVALPWLWWQVRALSLGGTLQSACKFPTLSPKPDKALPPPAILKDILRWSKGIGPITLCLLEDCGLEFIGFRVQVFF